jgi:hypothetical protein
MNVSVVGTPKLGRDVLKRRSFLGPLSSTSRLRRYAHQRKESLNFLCVDLNSTLPAPTALVIVDGDRMTAEFKLTRVRLT